MPNIDFSNGFTKSNLRALDVYLSHALKDFAKEYGLEVEMGGGRFDAGTFTPKFTFKVPDIAQAKQDSNLELWMKMNGLTKKESAEYVLTGYNSRRPKFPWSATSKVDGKAYKLTNTTAKVHFA